MSNKQSSNLLDSSQAIETYLDDLLQSATDTNQPAEQAVRNSESPVDQLLDDLLQAGTENGDPVRLVNQDLKKSKVNQKEEGRVEFESLSRSLPLDEDNPSNKAPATEAPAVEFPCQCMLFSVGKLNLAIPLMELKAVHVTDDQLTQLPGSDDLTLGILNYREAQLRVIDCHQLFGQISSSQKANQHFYLVLESCKWALACDTVSDIETIDQEDFQQRENKGKVISGNFRDSLTGLLDIQNLQEFVHKYAETRPVIKSDLD